jgi:hypothetical protein
MGGFDFVRQLCGGLAMLHITRSLNHVAQTDNSVEKELPLRSYYFIHSPQGIVRTASMCWFVDMGGLDGDRFG